MGDYKNFRKFVLDEKNRDNFAKLMVEHVLKEDRGASICYVCATYVNLYNDSSMCTMCQAQICETCCEKTGIPDLVAELEAKYCPRCKGIKKVETYPTA